jgi:hypothetical protein
MGSPRRHVSAHGNNKPQSFHSQTAKDKRHTARRVRKQDQRGKDEEESRGYHQQSGVFHAVSFVEFNYREEPHSASKSSEADPHFKMVRGCEKANANPAWNSKAFIPRDRGFIAFLSSAHDVNEQRATFIESFQTTENNGS